GVDEVDGDPPLRQEDRRGGTGCTGADDKDGTDGRHGTGSFARASLRRPLSAASLRAGTPSCRCSPSARLICCGSSTNHSAPERVPASCRLVVLTVLPRPQGPRGDAIRAG